MARASRRRFIQLAGIVGASCADPALLDAADQPTHTHHATGKTSPESSDGTYKALNPHQVAVLEAIADEIIPQDADPGGREAGVVRYIDHVLSGEQSAKMPLYEAGIAGCDQTSKLLFNSEFAQLKPQQQSAVLTSLESGGAPGEIWNTVSSRGFFSLVWNHVLEGFYGPPEHGGNKEHASWKMVGFPI
jgi:gluconate 2-dehydrogenase gamma chain